MDAGPSERTGWLVAYVDGVDGPRPQRPPRRKGQGYQGERRGHADDGPELAERHIWSGTAREGVAERHQGRGREAVIGLGVVLGGSTVVVYVIPAHSASDLGFIPLEFAISWLAGFAVRERAEKAEAAEVRATLAEREANAAARIAVAEERARIARELHDIVAHAVSVMVLQVGAVRHNLPEELAQDRDALRGVEQRRRTALADMRGLLGAMRRDGDEAELLPQPGLDGLESLLQEISRAGLPVRLRVDGEPFPLPPGIDLSAYRIVQEGLTNALKHAHADNADVTVCYRPVELQIEVRDDGEGGSVSDGLGHGLVGVRERVKIYGGGDDRRIGKRGWIRPEHPPPADGGAIMTIRVLVADDQSMVRAGFGMLLSSEQDIEVVAEAEQRARSRRPGHPLSTLGRTDGHPYAPARRPRSHPADPRADAAAQILVLTTFDLDEYVYEALRAGASGFVLKDDPPEQLIAAIRIVAAGDALLSPGITSG